MTSELNLNQSQENTIVNNTLKRVPYPHITGMKLRSDIHLNGLTFNTIDSNKCVWVCSDIDGWWEMPNAEVPDIPRGLDDGSYDVRGRWTARSLTFRGSVLVPDGSYTATVRDTLMNALNMVYTGGWLIVDEEPYSRAAYVRLAGQPDIQNVNPRGRIDFTVPLRAGDPIKYYYNPADPDGYTTSTNVASGVNVNNIGNYPVATVFELKGPMTAPIVIKSTDVDNVISQIRVTRNLRANGYTPTATVNNYQASAGTATLGFTGAHGFFKGDVVTITNLTNFNQTNVALTSTTETTISYENPKVNIASVVISSNVATVTTSSSHGLSANAAVYIKNCFNPLVDGAYTITANSVSGNTSKFTFSKALPNQTLPAGGTVSLQITSNTTTSGNVALVGADTLSIDTYNGTVLYRETPDYSRASLDSTVDWIKFQPGMNTVNLITSGGSGTLDVKFRPGWIG